jgi:DNA-binding PadR family transcriptional regulator
MQRRRRCSSQTLALLEALLEAPGNWHYGYELSKATALKSGTLYPLLMRLHDAGWLEERWEAGRPGGRPARHVYRLTQRGAAWAEQQLAERHRAGRRAAAPRGWLCSAALSPARL